VSRSIRTVRLRRLEGQLGEVAYQITKVHFASFRRPEPAWSPAINVFACETCLRISVELAGVDPDSVEVSLEPGELLISGEREAPEPPAPGQSAGRLARQAIRVLAMEIRYGRFERAIELPDDLVLNQAVSEWFNGLLWIKIPRRSHA
jgi:HSP20 family protein